MHVHICIYVNFESLNRNALRNVILIFQPLYYAPLINNDLLASGLSIVNMS